MGTNAIVGVGFVLTGLYCVVMPKKAKLSLRLGRFDDRTNFDWMADKWVRTMGVALVMVGAVIAKGLL